mmetsp:Transcript_9871/g.21510  ORF Transcript_9871/g.21510 Transcript_9871/m.21510 type:complete len:261 (-) Transcript_9871:49-831(-)
MVSTRLGPRGSSTGDKPVKKRAKKATKTSRKTPVQVVEESDYSSDEEDVEVDLLETVNKPTKSLFEDEVSDIATTDAVVAGDVVPGAQDSGELPTRLDVGEQTKPVDSILKDACARAEDGSFLSKTAKEQRKVQARKQGDRNDWFDMKVPELTPEVKQDLQALRLRNYMDPKRFYKTADSKTLPKEFQIGTVVEGLGEYKSHRVRKRDKKQTFVDEILADEKVQSYASRIFRDVQSQKQSGGKKDLLRKRKRMRQHLTRR